MPPIRLGRILLGLAPFVLVALVHHAHHLHAHAVHDPVASRERMRLAAQHGGSVGTPAAATHKASDAAGRGAAVVPAVATAHQASAANSSEASAASSTAMPHGLSHREGMAVYNRLLDSATVSGGPSGPSRFDAAWRAAYDDHAARYPPPTLSPTKLEDGSPNWLPVPDAESADPSDLRWRKRVVPGQACPPGRRPFHVLLTAQASLYQEWQTRIMHYHYRKVVYATACSGSAQLRLTSLPSLPKAHRSSAALVDAADPRAATRSPLYLPLNLGGSRAGGRRKPVQRDERVQGPRSGRCALVSRPALERPRIQLYSTAFTAFVFLVLTRCSEDTAHTAFPPSYWRN